MCNSVKDLCRTFHKVVRCLLRIISTDYYDEHHYLVYTLSFAHGDEQ